MGGNTNPHLEPDDVIIDYMPSDKHRYWIYTLNNPNKTLEHYATTLETKNIKYAMQIERGNAGTRHLQAVLRFANAVRFNTAKSVFEGESLHVEIARDPRKSVSYCTKEESREEGPLQTIQADNTGFGARTDLGQVAAAIKSGQTIKRVADQIPETFIKYSRGKPLFRYSASLCRPLRGLSSYSRSAHSKSIRGSGRVRFAPARDIGHYMIWGVILITGGS